MDNTKQYQKVILLNDEDLLEKDDEFFSTVLNNWATIPKIVVGFKLKDTHFKVVKRKNVRYIQKRNYWI